VFCVKGSGAARCYQLAAKPMLERFLRRGVVTERAVASPTAASGVGQGVFFVAPFGAPPVGCHVDNKRNGGRSKP
jgi:hypothetical protein